MRRRGGNLLDTPVRHDGTLLELHERRLEELAVDHERHGTPAGMDLGQRGTDGRVADAPLRFERAVARAEATARGRQANLVGPDDQRPHFVPCVEPVSREIGDDSRDGRPEDVLGSP